MSANPAYFATVPMGRIEREGREQHNRTQDELVLDWFHAHPDALVTAEDVHESLSPAWPLGSTRRAPSNLKNRYAIERTGHLVDGSQGHRAHCYRLARPDGQGQLL